MNNFFTLLKYSLLDSFKLNKLKKKNSKIRLEFLVALIYTLILAFVTLYMVAYIKLFKEIGNAEFIFLFAIIISSIITIVSTITKANVYIFRSKDYETLISLPIKPSVIVATKIVNLYILNFLFVFTICFAVDIAYFIVCGFNIITLLLSIIVIIFLPLLPTVLGSFIAFLFGFIPLRQKVRNILSTVLYVVITVAILVYYFSMMNFTDEQFITSIADLYAKMESIFFLGYWAYQGMIELNLLKLILFVLISICAFLLFVVLVGIFFKKINSSLSNHKTIASYNLQNEKYGNSKGSTITLFKKELRMYIGFPAYMINTSVGAIISAITTVMFALQFENLKITIEVLFQSLNIVVDQNIFIVLMAYVNVLFISMTSVTSASISLEGKSFWILKSLPLKTKSIFWSKIMVNLLISLPFAIINMIVCSFVIKGNILISIGAILIPIIYSFVGAFIGLYFNILKPNFNYDNPIKPVKQDLPVLFTMLVSFVVTFLGIGLLFGLTLASNLIIAFIVCFVIALIMLVISTVLLFKHGVKKYESIQI